MAFLNKLGLYFIPEQYILRDLAVTAQWVEYVGSSTLAGSSLRKCTHRHDSVAQLILLLTLQLFENSNYPFGGSGCESFENEMKSLSTYLFLKKNILLFN